MGGTFNPIHYGHLLAAEEVREQFRLEKVLFIPSGDPPHKIRQEVLPGEERYTMTVLAVRGNPYFEVSRMEIDRPGISYTADTLRQLQNLYGPELRLYFITGLDAILEMPTWHEGKGLLQLAEFVAVTRPELALNQLEKVFTEEERRHIYLVSIPSFSISSTEIRRRVQQGRSIRYLTPDSVVEYIYQHGFYKNSALFS